MKRSRSPYGNTAKRKRALAWMAARGITQPRALYPAIARTQQYVGLQFANRERPARLTSVSK